MQTRYFNWCACAGALLGMNLMAQTSVPAQPVIPVPVQQTMTTGMVGFTPNQTARLSVLNLNPVPATAGAQPNCTVELQFFDSQDHSLKQSVVPDFAPLTATSLDLTAPPQTVASLTPPTPARLQVRGEVTVNPAPTPVMSPAPTGYCSVMVSLEIFDTTTGSTIALTTDARTIGTLTGVIVPLAMRRGDFVPVPR